MLRRIITFTALALSWLYASSEGSKNLTPSSGDRGFLQHDDGANSNNFLKATANADERLYVYIRDGETLYYGLRRMLDNGGVNHYDLTIYLYENDGTQVSSVTLLRDQSSTNDTYFQTPQAGVIETYAQAEAGPSAIVGGTGYNALSYTNNTGTDQDFYIVFDEGAAGTAEDRKSWYDLWDFSVYNGQEEKPGRLHCKAWSFTAGSGAALSDEFQMYALVPSDISGISAGYYIKEIDIAGIQPFGMLIYANSIGADLAQIGDTNGDGTIDFQDSRMSQNNNVAELEYDLFINNPDIDIYPTTTLPSVTISDANFYCNDTGTGGEGAIYFNSNQDGFVSLLLDLNGINGYQYGTEDVIVEKEISVGSEVVRWDGLDGLGSPVPSGTTVTITGRFTSGPLHVPLWDVESNTAGITMLDVRPATSFNLIYWDDSDRSIGSSPTTEFDGTNTSQHTWTNGDAELINTWSFGYYQVNSQNITFSYTCDPDGDGVDTSMDLDSDNDGIANANEGPGDFNNDTDGDNVPDYLDNDLAGFTDSNGDGVNDLYDQDRDGIPDALDLDSDNDGIPDMVENGLTDANVDGTLDEGSGITDLNGNGLADAYDPACDGSSINIYVETASGNGNVSTVSDAEGAPDGATAQLNNSGILVLDFGRTIPGGTTMNIVWARTGSGQTVTATIGQSLDNSSYTNTTGNITIGSTALSTYSGYVLSGDARYLRITKTSTSGGREVIVDAASYVGTVCNGLLGTSITSTDSDNDGIPNFLDIDSDNDGIVDVVEAGGTADTSTGKISGFTDADGDGLNDTQEIVALALPNADSDGFLDYVDIDSDNDGLRDHVESQKSSEYIDLVTTDANGNGLPDVYDPTGGGTYISPVNTDASGFADYRDTDADNDGVPDIIEGWDSDFDGFSDLDTNTDGVIDDNDACASYTCPGILRSDNPDFENGLQGLASSTGSVSVTQDAQSGNSAILIGPNTGYFAASEFLNVIPGQAFELTAYVKISGTTDNAYVGFTFWDEDKSTRLSEPSGTVYGSTYGLMTVNATAPAGAAYVEIWAYKGGNTDLLYTDNFCLRYTAACTATLADDSDNDGLLDLFEPYNAPLQNTDASDESDWQDSDDDNDGDLTAGEDANSNGNWADDFTDGGIMIPDYLFEGDFDGDVIANGIDLDSDNDGILDSEEDNGESIDPSGDNDNDGIPNYRDAGIGSSLTSSADANGDGVFDVFDTDLDGRPDFLDLDSDNDGIWDAIEANEGSIPFELDESSGMFKLKDPDNDGLMNDVDNNPSNSGGASNLSNPDSDGDGIKDYLDTDADADGIPDLIEAQSTAAFVALANVDTDGDGIDDSFDPTNGGTLIVPVNSDGLDLQDYLDTDSDNDQVPDSIEGHDADFNGAADAVASGTDTDRDGLDDAYDTDNGGTAAALQNTDGSDQKDWRDSNDDNDDALTKDEDINGNGNYADDQTNGQSGAIPDYLFNGDKDGDGIYDEADLDADNDGIPDSSEDNGESIDPSGDDDNDGIPNFRDKNDAAVTGALSATTDSNGDGVYDVFDKDLDGIPDFLDLDSDNDGIADLIEAGGIDIDNNGSIDVLADTDGDGLADIVDTDNGGQPLPNPDSDNDGLTNAVDLDADNDGIPDIKEAGGSDTDGNGKVDDSTDTDSDGMADLTDPDNGGTAYNITDTDLDNIPDYLDVDSDNDGITDPNENGAADTNNDGRIDSYATDTDGDGLADSVDPDNGGTPISQLDTDGDGLSDYVDLDSDNDGYPDILEGGGTDSDNDGKVDSQLDSDGDGIPDVADVSNTGGADADGDGIDNNADADFTGSTDTDGDNIINASDPDADGNGFDDYTESNPYALRDTDGDGNKDFRDLDSDNDGLVDVIELGLTPDPLTGSISGFTDSNSNGYNDTQESSAVTPPNTDGDAVADFRDIDSDNDGIVDNYEFQTKNSYLSPSDTDTDKDGLDDRYDPNNGGSLLSAVNTDGTGNEDYLDSDADDDGVTDNIDGDNANKDQYADWDTNNNNNITDESGYNVDADMDGLWDIFDNNPGSGPANITGSTSAIQDTDKDGIWDFQDVDDDSDGVSTSGESKTPVADPNGIIPDYLFGNQDSDGDGLNDNVDLDSDNDGLQDASEDGASGVNPGGDIDGDGLMNFEDGDMDGDGINNLADNDADGNGTSDSWSKADSNGDGVVDVFDKDKDGIPDFRDRDSDNDGIADLLELGLSDGDKDGTLDEGSGITDSNNNGLEDNYDPAVCLSTGNASSQTNNGVTNPANALGNTPGTYAQLGNGNDLTLNFGATAISGTTVSIYMGDYNGGINGSATITQSTDNITFTNPQTYNASVSTPSSEEFTYTLSGDAQYVNIDRTGGDVAVFYLIYCATPGTTITPTDTDSDGIANYLDLDSDDDGITDNREAQTTASYQAPAAGDTDTDGILNVYDEDVATGNALTPVNTDGTAGADYIDTDSDDDGINDAVEGWDADSDGNADWDSDSDNDPTNEAGYANDNDQDGIRYLFDSYSGLGNISNIDASNQALQDTDEDGLPDYRDTDDDEDAYSSTAEDNNSNLNWRDDFTQGGNPIPDYLFNPDQDGDGVLDFQDGDADDDGIASRDEFDLGVIPVPGGGLTNGSIYDGDLDNDGIFNYLDSDMDGDGNPNSTDTDDDGFGNNFTDQNGDGVLDQYDQDFDGVPNFFDLDSDNDGIYDAVEANGGTVPAALNMQTGRFTGIDNDNDGIKEAIDPNDAAPDIYSSTTIANPNFDGDALNDYLDLDTDNDGIPDNIEAQNTASYVAPDGEDTNNDGVDDDYSGATSITPVNTDGTDEPDYRDTDSDNDTNTGTILGDVTEGFDANRNGFNDLDTNQDGILNNTDFLNYNSDTDQDGIWNIFDSFTGYGTNNITGSRANLQDTDNDGTLDFRDTDDDNDGITTAAEDINSNGNWTDDKAQGGGATPDYLYFNDTDSDKIADGEDTDGDNDGIPDVDEYDLSHPDPFGDTDADGVFNYNDPDNPGGLTDSDSDGIWDEYDWDLDGIPNFFDLDSDNDGIPDIVEAGGTDLDNDGRLDGAVDSDGDGIFDNVDVDSAPANGGSGTDADGDEIDDSFDVDMTGGTDADNDSIDDLYDLDDDGDGLINTIDPDEGGTALTNGDYDNDAVKNIFDYDSDNDGILDIIEAGGNDSNGNGILDGYGDTDGDGWGNSRDSDNGGTAFDYPNTDSTDGADYVDIDADADGLADFEEGFYEQEVGQYVNSYLARVADYNASTSSPNTYPATDVSPADGTPDYLNDHDGDGIFNLLDVHNSTYYFDDDNDGIINLFDITQNGNFYGNVNGVPDMDEDGTPNVLDAGDEPLPLDFLSFTGEESNGSILLNWTTTNEINVSHFEVEHSIDGNSFTIIGKVTAANPGMWINKYQYVHPAPVKGYNFYRIREVDFDGYESSTEVIYIVFENETITWTMYPNPVSTTLKVRSNATIPDVEITIMDLSGKIIFKERESSGAKEMQIDMTQFGNGVYHLMIRLPESTQSFRIIKK